MERFFDYFYHTSDIDVFMATNVHDDRIGR